MTSCTSLEDYHVRDSIIRVALYRSLPTAVHLLSVGVELAGAELGVGRRVYPGVLFGDCSRNTAPCRMTGATLHIGHLTRGCIPRDVEFRVSGFGFRVSSLWYCTSCPWASNSRVRISASGVGSSLSCLMCASLSGTCQFLARLHSITYMYG